MLVLKILKMLSAHRHHRQLEWMVNETHAAMRLDMNSDQAEKTKQVLPEHVTEDTLLPGF